MVLRPYQQEAVRAVYEHLRLRDDNPCLVLPTAAGKTPVIASICRDVVQKWDGRVLILAHVKELLEQAVNKLHIMAPDLWHRIGVYSAGLGSRDTEYPIIVAGIQSVYKRATELGHFDLILIDECHMLPPDGEGMYQSFLNGMQKINPQVRLIGLTATPYRMKQGLICNSDPESLLHHICYEVGVRELIVQGYLCPLKSKAGQRKVDTSKLHIRGGEFIQSETEALMDEESLVQSACSEIIKLTQDRHSVLIFAAGVKHAQHIQQTIENMGHACGFVCGDTLPFNRSQTLDGFKEQKLKYLVNVNVLTTGFDAPTIDCVVLLRPTQSPGLLYQMVGRGFRIHPSKQDCLILDYGGNILRHGPIDDLKVADKAKGTGKAPAKECPNCRALIHAAYSNCPECGYEFEREPDNKHNAQADSASVLSGQVTETDYEVQEVYYSVHQKRGAPENSPRTMRIDYRIGFNEYKSEWVCPEHHGYAHQKFQTWWQDRSLEPLPDSAEEAVAICDAGGIAETHAITVRSVAGEKFDRITSYKLGEKPPRMDGSASGSSGIYSDQFVEGLPCPDDEIPF
ncbi:type I restriction enzyme EcoKI subunit R [Poriferisphaera corsica]|uniref:Type I restriction enzyme EcoKI subunit R n=1 Tax=Poriferisphaera corsica TaxID=2528020 RepID=A0A517YS37_9BACT|nr:DEAD/DEAH box helicase family protein [Poriferisphaera corsica]QDU33034.1 type I restriction enzyme EcoKI subunit R [Poriferisphaera corsica]